MNYVHPFDSDQDRRSQGNRSRGWAMEDIEKHVVTGIAPFKANRA